MVKGCRQNQAWFTHPALPHPSATPPPSVFILALELLLDPPVRFFALFHLALVHVAMHPSDLPTRPSVLPPLLERALRPRAPPPTTAATAPASPATTPATTPATAAAASTSRAPAAATSTTIPAAAAATAAPARARLHLLSRRRLPARAT